MEINSEAPGLTMQEYLDDMLKIEKAATNFLQKNESNECTYSKGYITQTLYGCKTCNKKAGFCLGCYINCHSEHDTFEIGLKRDFRCDCGTSAFDERMFSTLYHNCSDPCSLGQEYREDNIKNAYDHNFEGKWCICDEPYDPNIFMIRCLHCLEYFHIHHLGIPEDQQAILEECENVTAMICRKCSVSKYKFLKCYPQSLITFIKDEITADKPTEAPKEENTQNIALGKRGRDQEEKCQIEEKLTALQDVEDLPLFLKDNWRNFLCLCEICQNMYKDNGIYEIVTKDEEENELEVEVEEIEKIEKVDSQDNQSTASTVAPEENTLYGAAMKEMNKLDFFTQSNIATLYREFYEEFKDFLDKFKDQNVVITDKHVKEFFEQLKEKKGIN